MPHRTVCARVCAFLLNFRGLFFTATFFWASANYLNKGATQTRERGTRAFSFVVKEFRSGFPCLLSTARKGRASCQKGGSHLAIPLPSSTHQARNGFRLRTLLPIHKYQFGRFNCIAIIIIIDVYVWRILASCSKQSAITALLYREFDTVDVASSFTR